jgi:hypothetical protein
MPSVFDVLGQDHKEVKRMLAELERGPIAATGDSDNHLILRKKMVEELVIEESQHDAVEVCRPAGNPIADRGMEHG